MKGKTDQPASVLIFCLFCSNSPCVSGIFMTKDANMTELMGKYGANRLMYGTNFPEPAVYCDQTKVLTHTHSTVAFVGGHILIDGL